MPFCPVNQSTPWRSKLAVLRLALRRSFGSGNSVTAGRRIDPGGRVLPAFGYRIAAGSCALLALTWSASAAEGPPKRGGTLTYLIPADSPPSFDGHREGTFAMVHATAPFYRTLIRINPVNPSSTTDFVCDLCTGTPEPDDSGKTYVFELRNGVKFHDGIRSVIQVSLLHTSEKCASGRNSVAKAPETCPVARMTRSDR
jgi:hypothetical protein